MALTVYESCTNAPNINHLQDRDYEVGGSATIPNTPVVIGGDFNIIPSSDESTAYFGITTNAGVGVPGVEGHIGISETETWNVTKFNVYDVAEYVYIKIMEW